MSIVLDKINTRKWLGKLAKCFLYVFAGKIQNVDLRELIQLTKKKHCDSVLHAKSMSMTQMMFRVTDLPTKILA